MKRIYTLCALTLLGFAISCSKSSDPETTPELPPEPFPEIKIAVSGPQRTDLKPVPQGNGESNFLGYGYDLTGKYEDSASVKDMVIDVPAFKKDHPSRYDNAATSMRDFRVVVAVNAVDLSEKLSNSLTDAAGSKLFKASITSFYPEQTAFSAKYVYGDYTDIIQFRQVKMMNHTLLQQYLSPGFTSDLQTMNKTDLVKKYGTHVLSNIFLGAKLHAVYQAVSNASEAKRRRSVEAGFTVAIQKVFRSSSGYLDVVTAADYSTISEAKIIYEAIGGDLSALKETTTVSPTRVNYADWLGTLKPEEAMFIGIDRDGLIPLYELIADPVKKAEVKEYIARYLKEGEVTLKD